MISPQDVSVVVQGPVIEHHGPKGDVTARVLRSIRHHLPGAEVILSTWSGIDDVSQLQPDVLVLSDDPGGMSYRPGDRFENNINRQIRSTKTGLLRSSRPYSLKLRTDLMLTSAEFLHHFHRFPARADAFRFFDQRLLSCATYSINPLYGDFSLFHPSDWTHFGKTSDMLKLWDVPEARESELMRWFEVHPADWETLSHRLDGNGREWVTAWRTALGAARHLQRDGFICQFSPEQYLWIQVLRKAGYAGFRDSLDVSSEAIRDSETSLANNFVILQAHQFGIGSLKYDVRKEERQPRVYTHVEWLRLYQQATGKREGAGALEWLVHGGVKLARAKAAIESAWNRLRAQKAKRCRND